MHILFLSPINSTYFGINAFFCEDDNDYSILINKRHLNNYKQNIKCKNVSFYPIDSWTENNIELSAIKIHSQSPIDKVISYDEFDVEVAAKIRDYLHIDGQTFEDSLYFRDKLMMKDLLTKRSNLLVPKYIKIDNILDVYKALDILSFPFIIKPRSGAGGEGCIIIRSLNDVNHYLAAINLKDHIAEEFITKPVYHIDGMITNNTIKYIIPSKYLQNCISYIDGKSCISIQLDNNDLMKQRLIDYTQKIISIFPFPANSLFHLEVFADEEGIYFCEIACRIGGGRILQSIEYKIKHNPLNIFFTYEVGKMVDDIIFKNLYSNTDITGFILVAPQEGIIKEIKDVRNYYNNIFDYYQYATPGNKYGTLESCVNNISAVSIVGKSEGTVAEQLLSIDTWYRKNTVYTK